MKNVQRFSMAAAPNTILTAALFAIFTAAAPAIPAAERESQNLTGDGTQPLVLRQVGSFFIGGRDIAIPYGEGKLINPTYEPADVIKIDQMYVQFMFPVERKHDFPVIFVHGAFHTGKTWEVTPDGREGWAEYFTRRGFDTYWVDKPWKGRSAFNPQLINGVERGDALPNTLPSPVILGHNGWSVFRFGPSYGVPNPGVQFPLEAVDEWLKQLVPDFSFYLRGTPSTVSYPALNTDVEALLKKTGPAVYIGHSQGGGEIITIVEAISNPNLFAGLISVEGGRCPPVADAPLYKNVPFLYVTGDFTTPPASCEPFIAALNALGGSGTSLHLPDLGIMGNDHMMMMDRNNLEVADVIQDWIDENVERKPRGE